MSRPAIVRIQVRAPEVPDSFMLHLAGAQYDLVNLLQELNEDEHEAGIQEKGFEGSAKLQARAEGSKPVVDAFFARLEEEPTRSALLPSNSFTKAAAYALERRKGLEVFLADSDVPLDTNNLERALRAIPMGRKNWLFCWTEVGAQHVGQIQALRLSGRTALRPTLLGQFALVFPLNPAEKPRDRGEPAGMPSGRDEGRIGPRGRHRCRSVPLYAAPCRVASVTT